MTYGPSPNAIYPNPSIKSVCFIKNVITRKNISVGDYTYYDDSTGPADFEAYDLSDQELEALMGGTARVWLNWAN